MRVRHMARVQRYWEKGELQCNCVEERLKIR
ncbi:hypothetical protein PSYAR_22739 [Pseudomonas syringae pv. aceris str. M302273]|nr:hypothetical protein PSYAR_22739 [Pseudomonas syringae pv. aceris str. M302273]